MTDKIQRMSERRQVNIEMIDRMARIEMGQEHLIEKLDYFMKATCKERGCNLNDDVVAMKGTFKLMKVAGGSAMVTLAGLLVKEVWPVFMLIF